MAIWKFCFTATNLAFGLASRRVFSVLLFLKRLFTQLGKSDPESNARLSLLVYSLFRNQTIFINAINTTENFGLIFLLGMYWLALEWLWQKSRKF